MLELNSHLPTTRQNSFPGRKVPVSLRLYFQILSLGGIICLFVCFLDLVSLGGIMWGSLNMILC